MQPLERNKLTAQLADGAKQQGIALSDTQLTRLIEFLALLAKWNAVYNLTAVRDPAQMVVQHLLDSLSIVPVLGKAGAILDVGAGGGLPGMVIAIWAAETFPQARVSMVDTVHKKTAFLTQVKAELGLTNTSVYTSRVEQLQGMTFDVITSRAFAELKDFISWSAHLLGEGGRFIAMKGLVPHEEIARLPKGWRVAEIKPLQVPGLQAERHLITIERG